MANSNILSFRWFMIVALALVVTLAGALAARDMAGAAAPVVVRPSNMQGWAFFDDNLYGGSSGIVSGPATPPLGVGSANLGVATTLQGMALGTHAYQGTRLDTITTLAYSSYRASGGSPLAISLGFDIDYDVTDLNTAYQGRLTFEPYYTNTVLTGTWQTWNTLTSIGTGNWWATGAPGNGMCPIGNPCTWSEVLADFPNAGLRNPGTLLFKAGSGWAGFKGSADALTIGVSSSDTTFDFEPDLATSTPTLVIIEATVTPTATPPPAVGGVSLDPGGALSREGTASHRSAALPFAAIALAAVVLSGGGFWLARRRLLR